MSRRVILSQFEATGGRTIDTYFDRTVKYIPADIVGAWVAVIGLVNAASGVPTAAVLWIAFAVGVALTALWTLHETTEPGKRVALLQVGISSVAFAVWVCALGGPFATVAGYSPLYGSLLLIFYTLAVPLIPTLPSRSS